MIIKEFNRFKLCKQDDFYYITTPNGDSLVDLGGTKEKLIKELERWKVEVDHNNPYMLAVENTFIAELRSLN